MFQRGGLIHADVVPVAGTSVDDLDEKTFDAYFKHRAQNTGHGLEWADLPLNQLLQNMGLGDGQELNLSGLLLFGKYPQRCRPAFIVKAVAFPGTDLGDSDYLDSEDIYGTLLEQFKSSFAFIRRNLHHVQNRRGFNTLGELEIPTLVLEELLVNALIHRDYFTSASIRVLIFADRLEIISPGHLPDSLSVAAIRQGKTNRRNPTLTEHAVQILPYRGLGSGIVRILKVWPHVELIDDVPGNQFIARVRRSLVQEKPISDQVSDQVSGEVLRLLAVLQGWMTRSEIQHWLGLKHATYFRNTYLAPALAQGLVEMSIPEKPRSRLQHYRLTAVGRKTLERQPRSKRTVKSTKNRPKT